MQRPKLDFEAPLFELEQKIKELRLFAEEKGVNLDSEISKLEEQSSNISKEIYSNLSPWQRVQIARHPDRPHAVDYINLMVDDFIELHGDRTTLDDMSTRCGFGRLNGQRVMIIGQEKGRETNEKIQANFGSPRPEGYRKALEKMRLAERFGLPIVTLIDTPGAFPGIEAEEHNQSYAIALNLREMSQFDVPVVSVVIGEGGSGGALGIGVSDVLLILEHAYYSVISPEGCAAILWKDGEKAPDAAQAMRITANDLMELGICDGVIAEPNMGAHHNPMQAAHNVKEAVLGQLNRLGGMSNNARLEARYQRLRSMGKFDMAAG